MILDEFIQQLVELQQAGHGSKQVFYRHGASGDCGPLSSAFVTNEVERETGPFDLEEGEQYISIYAGH